LGAGDVCGGVEAEGLLLEVEFLLFFCLSVLVLILLFDV